jgi:hypothetical protein
MSVATEKLTDARAIRQFTIDVAAEDLDDLRVRIAATRWPESETVADDSQGVPLALMQDLARYWATDYDWRTCEARLEALPNFVTEIDGLDLHFIHVRSKHDDALPLVVCHGWPGSIIEQLKLIGPLTDPTAHGAPASDAFHLVIPSMPGYGFSGKPTGTGWGPVRTGKAYVELMKRLGYTRFVAQGGDWGAIVVDLMAGGRSPGMEEAAPPELIGIHTNMAGAVPPELFSASFAGSPPPSGLSDEELSTYEQLRTFFATHVAYGLIAGTRPQTLYGLADSPVDLAAFMLDHGDGLGQPGLVQQVLEDRLERPSDLTRDDILDNITLFLGTLQPTLPVVQYNDTRLLSSTYSGGMLNSKKIQGLDFNAGRLTKANFRDSSNRDEIGYAGADSDHFDFAGGAYAITPQLTASYYYGDLADIYKQHFVGLVHVLPLSDSMSLRTDLRYFKSTDNGNRLAGKIDNDFFNGMLSLSSGAHKFSGALQRLSGDGNFPFLRGGDPYSVNLVTFNTFTKAETDAWQLRYDFNFAELGIPGLAFMTRYTSGRNIEQGAVRDGREWERDSDLVYTLQEGTLKGLNIRLRNVTFRSGDGLKTDVDENRLIVGYTLPLW